MKCAFCHRKIAHVHHVRQKYHPWCAQELQRIRTARSNRKRQGMPEKFGTSWARMKRIAFFADVATPVRLDYSDFGRALNG